jgi:uncharacterized protein (TIGR02679 family)
VTDLDGAVTRLSDPVLRPLVDELGRRFGSGAPPVRVTIPAMDRAGLSRIADLLGRDRLPAPGRHLQLGHLVDALGLSDIDALRRAVEAVIGPLGDRRRDRAVAAAARDALWSDLAVTARSLPVFRSGESDGSAAEWVDRVRRSGVPDGDVDRHRRRLDTVLAVLARLPADEPVLLANLAVDTTGSAHGLDRGQRIAALVLDALAAATGGPNPLDAETVRDLWERVGVVPDQLSSTVLTLGLRSGEDSAIGRYLDHAAEVAEPVVLTLAQLPAVVVSAEPVAVVVENPSLLGEARRWWDGPPLVCSSGRPSLAVVRLVRRLVQAGTVVHQHADFDPAGLSITAWLADRAGTVPWRMGAADYQDAVDRGSGVALVGAPAPTPWDPALSTTMAQARRAVHEEALRDELLDAARALLRDPGNRNVAPNGPS